MEPEQKSNGALIGSIIIIIILVIGGIYFWKNSLKERALPQTPNEEVPAGTEEDVTGDIEADLDGIDLESLDSEI